MASSETDYRTMSLHEWHVVGRTSCRRCTGQCTCCARCERAWPPTPTASTRRTPRRRCAPSGGARAGAPRVDGEGLTVVDLEFVHPLEFGETASLEYETAFTWKTVPPQVRRATRKRLERLDMRVQFSPERRPAELQWAVWDGYGPAAKLRAAEVVELDHECAAHRFVDEIQQGTVGFTWRWAPGDQPTAPAG
jgi:hypothetical protein